MKQWECIVCGWIYDELVGDPDSGIAPGTKFEDIPDDWLCPECGVGKDDFELVDVPADNSTTASESQPNATSLVANDSQGSDDSDDSDDSDGCDDSEGASNSDACEHIVIIGTGLAGYGLLKELRKIGNLATVTMVTEDDGRAYSKPALSTGYTKGTSHADLTQASANEMAAKFKATILINTVVRHIDVDAKLLSLGRKDAQSGVISFDKLVIAQGASCIMPALEGDAVNRVHSINNLTDFAKFQEDAINTNAKKIAIIGAGLIGCEYANDLLNGGFEVDIIDPMAHCLPSLLPEAAGRAVQRGLEQHGAKFHFGQFAMQVNLTEHNQGVSITLDNGDSIEAHMVLSAIGVKPNIELASRSQLQTNRGICVDKSLQTSAKNIYALGDCAEVLGMVLVYVSPLVAGCRALAQTLSGKRCELAYPAMPVSVKTPACPVVVCPPPNGSDGEWNVIHVDDNDVIAEYENAQGEVLGFALTGKSVTEKARLLKEVPDWL